MPWPSAHSWSRVMAVALLPHFATSSHATPRVHAVTPDACAAMHAGHALGLSPHISCERLAIVDFDYLGFDESIHGDGRVVVMDVLAADVEMIFKDLLAVRFPISRARPVEAYMGDNDASMANDNSSAFNDRNVAGSRAVSMHALGAAIDVNPVENPQVASGTAAPLSGAAFVDRSHVRRGMVEPIVHIFAAHGFGVWGGRWRRKDYQHFQISSDLAQRLAAMPRAQAFEAYAQMRVKGP